MMNPLISIVIPVFNAEKYIKQCIDSVLAQTYDNYEIIIVNDGSTDKTGELIDYYSKKYNRIHYYLKQNGGVSSARNYGIDKSSGDYICFIDADDIIENIYLETLYYAMQGIADCSVGGFKYINVTKEKEITVLPIKEEIKNLNDSILDFLDYEKPDWQRYMVNRLFKKSIINYNQLKFREDIFFKEDGLFLIDYLCASNGLVGYANKVIYYYRQNHDSALGSLNKKFNKRLFTNLDAHLLILERLNKNHLPKATIEKARTHAFMSCAWISDILKENNIHKLSDSFLLESYSFRILGLTRYLKWKIALLMKLLN